MTETDAKTRNKDLVVTQVNGEDLVFVPVELVRWFRVEPEPKDGASFFSRYADLSAGSTSTPAPRTDLYCQPSSVHYNAYSYIADQPPAAIAKQLEALGVSTLERHGNLFTRDEARSLCEHYEVFGRSWDGRDKQKWLSAHNFEKTGGIPRDLNDRDIQALKQFAEGKPVTPEVSPESASPQPAKRQRIIQSLRSRFG